MTLNKIFTSYKEKLCPFLQSVFEIETRELLSLSISTKDFVKTLLGSVEFTRNSKASVLSFIDR